MPGMMDTLLNCGLHPELADDIGDTPGFWAVYLHFIAMFASTVADIPREAFAALGTAELEGASREVADALPAALRRQGRPGVPHRSLADPRGVH